VTGTNDFSRDFAWPENRCSIPCAGVISGSVVDTDLEDFTVETDDRFELAAIVPEIDFKYTLTPVALLFDFGNPGAGVGLADDRPDLGLSDRMHGSTRYHQ
jgi:hypothetical protein